MSYWDRKRKQPEDIVVSDSEPDEETAQDDRPRRAIPPSQSTILEPPTELRGYQKDAVNACLEALKEGLTRIAVSSPTASGKTVMFMALMPLVPAPLANAKADKILILTNNLLLFNQTKKMVQKEHGKRYAVGVYQAGNRPTEHEDVIVATWQTLVQKDNLKNDLKQEEFKLIIADEAHQASADSVLRILHYFNDGVMIQYGKSSSAPRHHGFKVPIIGFSATLDRSDKRHLSWCFQKVVFHLGMDVLLSQAYVAPLEIKSAQDDIMALWDRLHITKTAHASKAQDTVGSSTKQAAGVQKPDKAKQDKTPPRKMAELVDSQDFYTRVVETYEQHAKTRRTTLVFCATVDMVTGMTKRFNDAGIKAREVTGSTPHAARDARIASFAAGDFPVLVNCQLLTQGINIPAIDCVIIARPTESKIDFTQMVGRGTRLSPDTDKSGCLILDIFGTSSRFGVDVLPRLGESEKSQDVEQKRSKSTVAKKTVPMTKKTASMTKKTVPMAKKKNVVKSKA